MVLLQLQQCCLSYSGVAWAAAVLPELQQCCLSCSGVAWAAAVLLELPRCCFSCSSVAWAAAVLSEMQRCCLSSSAVASAAGCCLRCSGVAWAAAVLPKLQRCCLRCNCVADRLLLNLVLLSCYQILSAAEHVRWFVQCRPRTAMQPAANTVGIQIFQRMTTNLERQLYGTIIWTYPMCMASIA